MSDYIILVFKSVIMDNVLADEINKFYEENKDQIPEYEYFGKLFTNKIYNFE